MGSRSLAACVLITGVKADLHGLPADVHVAFAAADAENDALAVLSSEERERLSAFGHADRRRSFVLGRLAARTLLAELVGGEAASAPLGLSEGGAPRVAGHGLYVSIAHAGRGAGVAAVAAVASRPVGVDLEIAGPRHPGLLRRLLGPGESSLPSTLDVPDGDEAALIWTIKESVLKGLGTGLRRGARSVIVEARERGLAEAYDGETAWWVRYERSRALWVAVAWTGDG